MSTTLVDVPKTTMMTRFKDSFRRFRARSWKEKIAGLIGLLFLMLVGVSCLVPFLWMASTSLMDTSEVVKFPPNLLPEQPLWTNYSNALTAFPFPRFFLNTVIMAVGVIVGRVVITSMAGYAFARIDFPARNKIFFLFLATMMIPPTITLIPSFVIIASLGWVDTFYALIVPWLNYVWGIFLLRQFLSTLPVSLEDAARIDGAGELAIFWRIFFPLAKPAVVVVIIFSFVDVWKAFMWPLIVTRSMEMRTIELGVAMFAGAYSVNFPYQMAAATAVAIPIIVIYLVAQKYFIEGINLAGSQKM